MLEIHTELAREADDAFSWSTYTHRIVCLLCALEGVNSINTGMAIPFGAPVKGRFAASG